MTALLLTALLLPVWEMETVNRIADDYDLTREEIALMVAIRRAENGKPHIAFGVADPKCRGYERQARWCANTIRLRYDGSVERFARRWCPCNWRVWARNVRWFMRKQGMAR